MCNESTMTISCCFISPGFKDPWEIKISKQITVKTGKHNRNIELFIKKQTNKKPQHPPQIKANPTKNNLYIFENIKTYFDKSGLKF